MRLLFSTVLDEHERLRDSLRELMLLAARARQGDTDAWFALTQRDLKSELEAHAISERAQAERIFAADDARRHRLDDLHQTERRAAMLLRFAPDLEHVLIHIGDILEALADEERVLQAFDEQLEAAHP